MNSTFSVERLGLTNKNQNYPPFGTPPSPGSVSEWRSTNNLGLLSSKSWLTLCTHLLLMANTETPYWVVTSGRRWLAATPLYSPTVTRKDSMPLVVEVIALKPELVLLTMTRTTAFHATLWLDLEQEVIQKAQNPAETRHSKMEGGVSKPWGIYWCNKTNYWLLSP